MKSVNYALLLMVSPFIIAGCGADSVKSPSKEASIDDVAILVDIKESSEDEHISQLVDESAVAYEKAGWIPGENSAVSSSKHAYKVNYSSISTSDVRSLKVESNGGNSDDWRIYSGGTDNATITSEYDSQRGSDVIVLKGDGTKSGYVLGYSYSKGSTWKDATNKVLKWSMKFNEKFVIYVRVSTKDGYRYLYYTSNNKSYGVSSYDAPHYIHNGLGSASDDGKWITFTRNLSADLKRFDRFNEITSVDGFFVRGSGSIDDIELLQTKSTIVNETVYENAEDGKDSRWKVYDNNPAGATITNVDDADKSSKVIELKGDGTKNGFVLGSWDNRWKNTINKEISWDIKTNEGFVVYISVITAKGHRFMTYSPLSDKTFASNPNYTEGRQTDGKYTYLNHHFTPSVRDGSWNTISRNLELDLKAYEPNNSLISVSGFLIRANARVDNIKMFDTNTDGDYDNSTN